MDARCWGWREYLQGLTATLTRLLLRSSSVKRQERVEMHPSLPHVSSQAGYPKEAKVPRNNKTPNTRSIKRNQRERKTTGRQPKRADHMQNSSHTQLPLPSNNPFPSYFSFALLATAPEQPAHGPADALAALHQAGADLLPALGDGVDDGARGPGRVAPVLVLALALGAVDALLGEGVPDGLEEAVLADLAGDEAVDAVLEVVDLLVARDLGLAQGVCFVGARAVSVGLSLLLLPFLLLSLQVAGGGAGRERGMNIPLVA